MRLKLIIKCSEIIIISIISIIFLSRCKDEYDFTLNIYFRFLETMENFDCGSDAENRMY